LKVQACFSSFLIRIFLRRISSSTQIGIIVKPLLDQSLNPLDQSLNPTDQSLNPMDQKLTLQTISAISNESKTFFIIQC
jgi:hypothetical protein